jgi:hypothetical protein
MNEYIEVKNNSGTKVRYENVEAISLPTSNGKRVIYKKWVPTGPQFLPV